ncbi:MAG: hypothetical protein KKA07_08025, partial [Bacteroidetes bacterium]|nr:hypothetical protein [Bacteroidota bacterium]
MVKHILILLLLFSIGFPVGIKAQNYVPNPGFEDVDTSGKHIWAPWRWMNTVDFYYMGDQIEIDKIRVVMTPNSGECFAGFRAWSDYKEILQIKLYRKMAASQKFLISFYVRRPSYGNSYLKNIGVALYVKPILYTVYNLYEKYPPQIVFDKHSGIQDTGWVKLSAVYTAIGGEDH